MRTNAAAAFALATLAAIAVCPSRATCTDLGKAGPKACSALIVTADKSEDTATTRKATFRASRILDVRVRAVISSSVMFEAVDVVTFRFTTPKGNLYQTIDVPVRSSAKKGEAVRRVPGYPFPLAVQQPQSTKVDGTPAQTVEARLPVGGTMIMESGLYGEWGVQAFVGGARPCSAAFVLQP